MSNATRKNYEEIMEVIRQYLNGGNNGSKYMEKAFHPNAIVNGESLASFFKTIDESGPTNSLARVDILDVVNDIACARVVLEDWHGINFIDFHQLLKTENGWKIVSKIFTEV